MMKNQSEIESQIQEWLEEIKPVPARDPHAAARNRARFLSQAVSAGELRRHKGWKFIFRKEQLAMNVLMTLLVIAGLLFGGGATVNAAQDDLPNEPLYSLKLWEEDLSLRFQNDPEQKVDRLMELAQVRIEEMTRLADSGQAVPDQTRQRLEQHIHQALQICTSLEDAALDQALLQIRDRLQQQDRDMDRLQLHLQTQPALAQTQTMLQERLRLIDAGLLDHEMFRNAARNGFRYGQEEEVTPPAQNGNGEQNGQPSTDPIGPNTAPGGPNTDPGGPNPEPGEPNTDPGGPNTDPGGPNMDSGGSGGSGSGGEGSTDKDPGGNSTGEKKGDGDGSGGGGSGGNKP